MIRWERTLLRNSELDPKGPGCIANYQICTALGCFSLRLEYIRPSTWEDGYWSWGIKRAGENEPGQSQEWLSPYVAHGQIWRTPTFEEAEAIALKDSLPCVLSDLEKLAGLGEDP